MEDDGSTFYYEQINDYDSSFSRALWCLDGKDKPARVEAFSDRVHLHDRHNRCVVIDGDQFNVLLGTLGEVAEWRLENGFGPSRRLLN